MFHAALHKIRHCFRLIGYFLTDTPPLYTVLEAQLEHLPETQAQRIKRRWQRSRERATRQQMKKAAQGELPPSCRRIR
jgi:hypothetical protein